MMPSLYDDETFFAAYAAMPRSRGGLAAAGEWHQLRPLLPPLTGKRGTGTWGAVMAGIARYAAQQGAAKVLGLDASRRMIAQARACNPGECISYRVCGIEEYEYPAPAVGLCDFQPGAALPGRPWTAYTPTCSAQLTPGGVFLFNIEHPVYTAGVGQGLACMMKRPPYLLAGGRLLLSRRAAHALFGVRGNKATPHADTDPDGPFAPGVCAAGRGRSPTPAGNAERAGHGGRNAPPHDAAGQSSQTGRLRRI